MYNALVSMPFTLVSLTWLAMQIAVETTPPFFATGMRPLFVSPFLIGIAWLSKAPLLFPPRHRVVQFAIAIFYHSFTLMSYGETYVNSGLASIIFANMPMAVSIVSYVLLNEKIKPAQIAGLIMAIAALIGILLKEIEANSQSQERGYLALITAIVIHAVIYTQCKKRDYTVSVITFNALPCLVARIIFSIAGWLFEKPQPYFFRTVNLCDVIPWYIFRRFWHSLLLCTSTKGDSISGINCVSCVSCFSCNCRLFG